VWNVARLLIEHAQVPGQSFVNLCGYEECVRVTHWRPLKVHLRLSRRSFTINNVNGQWQLWNIDDFVCKDVVVPGYIPPGTTTHLVRALYEGNVTRFVTACGVTPDPTRLVLDASQPVTCEACLR
jgi:hypothetical protein